MSDKKISVLVVDDSASVRKLLTEILSSDKDIEVVATAMDAFMARDKIKRFDPDVITLDVEMPKMDGLTFLRNLMHLRPTPVIMVSTLTEKGAEVTLDALAYGAVDFVTKPKIDFNHNMQDYADELISKVKSASKARVRQYTGKPKEAQQTGGVAKANSADAVIAYNPSKHFRTTDKIIAIGASTGGTEAIRAVLEALPATTPGIVITQHIPAMFSAAFAERANRSSALHVQEAVDGAQVIPGYAYVAPGGKHLLVVKDGARWRCKISDGVPVNRHKPSVDVLFRSVAQTAGPNAVGVIMTGMGKDGAQGLKEMLDAGASTIAQDEASSVVWGMPGSAVECGGVEDIVPLDAIAGAIIRKLQRV